MSRRSHLQGQEIKSATNTLSTMMGCAVQCSSSFCPTLGVLYSTTSSALSFTSALRTFQGPLPCQLDVTSAYQHRQILSKTSELSRPPCHDCDQAPVLLTWRLIPSHCQLDVVGEQDEVAGGRVDHGVCARRLAAQGQTGGQVAPHAGHPQQLACAGQIFT